MSTPYPDGNFTDSDNEALNNDKTANKLESGEAIIKTKQLVSYGDDLFEDSSSEKEEVKSTHSPDLKIKTPREVLEVEIFPEPKSQCDPELQEKIRKMMHKMKETDCDWNSFIQERKSFRNPSIYEKLIEFCGINEYGTNYKPEIYNPSKWGSESFYEELFRVQKSEIEKRKELSKIQVITGVVKNKGSSSVVTKNKCQSLIPVKETDKPGIDLVNGKRRKTKWDEPTLLQKAKSEVSIATMPATNPMESNLLFGLPKTRKSK